MKFVKVSVWLLLLGILCGCEESMLSKMDLNEFLYRGRSPVHVAVYDSSSVLKHVPDSWNLQRYAISSMADLDYAAAPGDTLHVQILEFASDMAALAFYLNTGLVQENLPVIEGDFREAVLRSGKRLFIFRYGLLRNHERGELERLVRCFPDSRAGLPQEFLSLPLANRISGETSIQMRNFFGVPSEFPMLVQGFRAGDVEWDAARSWESVPEEDWNAWIRGLRSSGRRLSQSRDTLRFELGAFERGMAMRLQGGRIVCVWGALDATALKKRFEMVAKRVFDSPK